MAVDWSMIFFGLVIINLALTIHFKYSYRYWINYSSMVKFVTGGKGTEIPEIAKHQDALMKSSGYVEVSMIKWILF